MAKLESTITNMIISLSAISLVMTAALGFVYLKTKGPIAEANDKKVQEAIALVVPAFDNNPSKEMYKVGDIELYPAKKGDSIVGTAIKTYTQKGFSGFFSLMVGILPDGTIKGISVLEQKETPGLGSKMSEPNFKNQFLGKSPEKFSFKVKKDGGQVDAITASTITSRAYCDALDRAFDAFQKGGKK